MTNDCSRIVPSAFPALQRRVNGRPRLDQFKEMLSGRTRIVAFTHVSNVLGYVNPAKEICALARQAGAHVVVDGAQGVPHVKVDVQDLGCDFYVFSGQNARPHGHGGCLGPA